MTSNAYPMAALALLISSLACASQANAYFPVASSPPRPGFDVLVSPAADLSTTQYIRHRHAYRYAYRHYHPTLPYDGYRPYPPPIYYCPAYGPRPFFFGCCCAL